MVAKICTLKRFQESQTFTVNIIIFVDFICLQFFYTVDILCVYLNQIFKKLFSEYYYKLEKGFC